jgi:hypothetical protein
MDNTIFTKLGRLHEGPSQCGVRTPAPAVRVADDATYHEWDSPSALVMWLAERPGAARGEGFAEKAEYWSAGATPEESARRAVFGWPEGLKDLKDAVTSADKSLYETGPEVGTIYDTSGSFVDVAAYLSGQPECMVDFAVVEHAIKRLHITVDGFVSAGVNASILAARGRAVVSAAMALQARGIAVDITYRMRYRTPETRWEGARGKTQDFSVKLWESGGVTDLGTLAGTLIAPGFLRQLFFEGQVQAVGNTYGGIAGPQHNRWQEVQAQPGTVTVESNLILKEGAGRAEQLEWEDPKAVAAFIAKCFAAAV